MQTDIAERPARHFDMGERLRNPVFKGFAADKAMIRQHIGAVRHMLATAEADFKMQRPIKTEKQFGSDRALKRNRNLRQQMIDQFLVPVAQFLASTGHRPVERCRVTGLVRSHGGAANALPRQCNRFQASAAFRSSTRSMPFPREEIALWLAAEMAIGGGLAIDRLVEAEMRADRARGQAAQLCDAQDRRFDPVVTDGAGVVRIDIERQRLRHADRIGQLDRAARGEAGGNDVLGEIAGDIGRRTVDLGRVLAAENAPPPCGAAPP